MRAFVLGALSSEAFPFNLLSTGKTLEDDNATLAELGLVRSAFITSLIYRREQGLVTGAGPGDTFKSFSDHYRLIHRKFKISFSLNSVP